MTSQAQFRHNQMTAVATAAVGAVPTVAVVGYNIVGKGFAHIVADVVHNQQSREDHNLVGVALCNAFENKMAAVAGSFQTVSKGRYEERVSGVVRVNTQSVMLTDDLKGFRSVSSNIFMDEEEKMWVLRKTEAGDILVKNTGIEDHESLRGLLDAVCSNGYSLSSEYDKASKSLSSMQHNAEGGDYVEYVSTSSNTTKFGFVVARAEQDQLVVLSSDMLYPEGEVISTSSVIRTYDTESFPDVEFSEQEQMDNAVAEARGVIDLKFLLEYYRKVFQRGPEFFKQFEARVRQHAFM